MLEDSSIAKKGSEKFRVNEEILRRREVREILLIDEAGEPRGKVSPVAALEEAKSLGLSLVEISPNANPPVCRMMDYGKFIYDQKKKQATAKKKQKQVEIKEVKFRPTTDDGDFQVKLRSINRFLEDGDKVKITVRFRGREVIHNHFGKEILDKVAASVAEIGVIEQTSKMEGRLMMMVIGPKKSVNATKET